MCQKSSLFPAKSLFVISPSDGCSSGGVGGGCDSGDGDGDGGVFGSDSILHQVTFERFFLVAI